LPNISDWARVCHQRSSGLAGVLCQIFQIGHVSATRDLRVWQVSLEEARAFHQSHINADSFTNRTNFTETWICHAFRGFGFVKQVILAIPGTVSVCDENTGRNRPLARGDQAFQDKTVVTGARQVRQWPTQSFRSDLIKAKSQDGSLVAGKMIHTPTLLISTGQIRTAVSMIESQVGYHYPTVDIRDGRDGEDEHVQGLDQPTSDGGSPCCLKLPKVALS
jgi:hypothetical protein